MVKWMWWMSAQGWEEMEAGVTGFVVNIKISYISCTNTQNFDVSRLVLQLSLTKLLIPGIKSRMTM